MKRIFIVDTDGEIKIGQIIKKAGQKPYVQVSFIAPETGEEVVSFHNYTDTATKKE
jgi:hypothetical protein